MSDFSIRIHRIEDAPYRHGQGVELDADDTPPPFFDEPFCRGLLWGIGLSATVGLVGAAAILGPLLTAGGGR